MISKRGGQREAHPAQGSARLVLKAGGISQAIAGSFRPTPMPGSICSASRIESRDRSRKLAAGRKLFELADVASKARKAKPTTISPIAFEAVQRFDAIFALERSINGLPPEARVAARRKDIAPLVND